LYLSTELENPNFFPSVYNFVTIINFTVTFQGLQDELLSTVVSHEVPHLENQRAQLLESISLDAITLEELEDKTLTLLQKAEGEEGNVVQSRDLKSQGKGMSLFSDWYQPCLASVSTR
jgi:dynein heavy chain